MALIEESFDNNEEEQQTSDITQEAPEQREEPQESISVLPDKYKGKSLEDIVKMHQEAEKMIGRQAQEVHEVRSLADQLLKRQLETNKSEPEVDTNAPEVDFFENPQSAVQRAIEKNPDIVAAKQAALELKRMKTAQQLASKHPDFGQIAQDAGFQDWVKASKFRLDLYAKADAEFDFDAADELFSSWKERQALVKTTVETQKADRKQQVKQASTGSVKGSAEPVSRKIYRRSEIIDLMRKDPQRYMDLQPEIMAAYAEGRVR